MLDEFVRAIELSIQESNVEQLANSMGYARVSPFKSRVDQLLKDSTLGLSSSHYDFHYDGKQFLINLSKMLQIDESLLQCALSPIEARIVKFKTSDPYIQIKTRATVDKKPPVGMVAQALYAKKRHDITFEEFDLDLFKMLEKAALWSTQHYDDHKGVLENCGDIDSYVYHEGDESYVVYSAK